MELTEFAASYPDLYRMLNNNVRNMIVENNITGEVPLREWDNLIDSVLMLNDDDYLDTFSAMDAMPVQQMSPFFPDRDRDRDRDDFDRRRRRRRDFDLRDIIRLIFLREMFDRNRRRY